MTDRNVDVNIRANASGLKDGMDQAAASVEQGGQRMRAALDSVSIQFMGAKQMVDTAVRSIKVVFQAAFKGAVDFSDEASKAAQKAGVTTEQLTSMAYAAKLSDVTIEELTRAYARLNGTLVDGQQGQKEAAELFRRLKLDPKGIKDADELLLALAERFAAMNDGAAKTGLAIDTFGERIGPRLIPFLNQGRAGIEDLREEASRLGIVVSTQTGKAAEEFNDTLTKIQGQIQGVQLKLATSLLPTMQAAATAFKDLGSAGKAAEFVAAAIRITLETLAVVGANVAFVLEGIGRDLGAMAAQLAALARGDFTGFRAISEAVKADAKRAREELDLFERRILRLGGPGTRENEDRGYTPASGAAGTFTPLAKKPEKKDKADKPESMMPYYDAALEEERRLATERDALHGMSKQAEADYWQTLLVYAQLSEADRVAVGRKASAARVAVLMQEARETQQISGISLAAWRDAELAKVDLDEEGARNRVALGQATQAQLLAQEEAFEQRRFEIKLAALRDSVAALDPLRDPVQVAQLHAQIESLEQAHQLRLKTIRGQAAVESAAELRAIWDDLGNRMASLWDQGVNAMMNGTLTWRNAFRAVSMELVGLLSNVVKRGVTEWIIGEQAKTGVTAAGTAQRGLIETAAAAKSVLLWASSAVKNIMTSAWEAMAAAWKAIVGIPVVGPILAPVTAAATFAGVAALAGRVSSAAGGYDIPAGVNPLTQLHSREMVLPARYADVIRAMSDGRPGAGAGAGAARSEAPVHLNLKIDALDGASVKRVLLDNTHHLAEAIRSAVRNNMQLRP